MTQLIPCLLVSNYLNRSEVLGVVFANSRKIVQGQGGGQAIEDGGALGVLFDQLHDKGEIESRLQIFEQVRRNRGSALQVLSNTNPPPPHSVREAAAKYVPGAKFDSTDAINDYVLSFDVIAESKAALAATLA